MIIFDIYNLIKKEQFCFAYLDHFSDEFMDPLLSMQDARSDAPRKVKKKINYLMTECFQNIVRHSERKDEVFENFFSIRTPGEDNLITTINPVRKTQKDKIINSFSTVANLDKDELRKVYLEALNDNQFSDKGGAGLGIIEMARKAKRLPRYAFEPWNEDFDAFELELTLSESEKEKPKGFFYPSFDLFEKLKGNNVLMVQKGDFSQESVMSLFNLIESNLRSVDASQSVSKKMYLLIELLQNMSKNAATFEGQKDGIFMIRLSEDKKRLIFETGNYISHEDGNEMVEYLDKITQLNKIELQKLYKKELLSGIEKDNESGNAGIGLLEIIKNANGALNYKLEDVNQALNFICLSTDIEY